MWTEREADELWIQKKNFVISWRSDWNSEYCQNWPREYYKEKSGINCHWLQDWFSIQYSNVITLLVFICILGGIKGEQWWYLHMNIIFLSIISFKLTWATEKKLHSLLDKNMSFNKCNIVLNIKFLHCEVLYNLIRLISQDDKFTHCALKYCMFYLHKLPEIDKSFKTFFGKKYIHYRKTGTKDI